MRFAELNFKNAASSARGLNFFGLWLLCTLLNAATVFVLVAAGLLAWRCFA